MTPEREAELRQELKAKGASWIAQTECLDAIARMRQFPPLVVAMLDAQTEMLDGHSATPHQQNIEAWQAAMAAVYDWLEAENAG